MLHSLKFYITLHYLYNLISIHIDGNQSYKEANEKKELESVLRKKEDTLRKLKLVKMYRAKVIVRHTGVGFGDISIF